MTRIVPAVKLIDVFLPPSIKKNPTLTVDTLIRARVTSSMMICILTILVALSSIMLMLDVLTERDFTSSAYTIHAIAGLITLTQYLTFYKWGNLAFTAISFSVIYFLSTLAAVFITGGWDSPCKQMLFCAPLVSFLLAGKQEGFYTSALVVVFGLVMLGLDMEGYAFKQIMREENTELIEGCIWVITSILLITTLAIYDTMFENLSQRISMRDR